MTPTHSINMSLNGSKLMKLEQKVFVFFFVHDSGSEKFPKSYSEVKQLTRFLILLSFHEFLSDWLHIYRVNRWHMEVLLGTQKFRILRLPQIKNLEGKRWIVGFQIMKWTKKLWASYTLSQQSELPDVFKSLFSKPRAFHPYIFVQIHWPSWMRHFVFPFYKDATNFFNE